MSMLLFFGVSGILGLWVGFFVDCYRRLHVSG